jgi:hypothetical protein
MRSRASSFKSEYPLLSPRSSRNFLRLLPRLLVTSIRPFIFPSITSCRRQFLRKIWPIQLALRFLISCKIFLCSLTLRQIWTKLRFTQLVTLRRSTRFNQHLSRSFICQTCRQTYTTHIVIRQLTPWSRVLLEKLILSHLVSKLSAFYCAWRLNTCYMSLAWTSSIWSTSRFYFLKIHFNIMLPSTPRSCLCSSSFPTKSFPLCIISATC